MELYDNLFNPVTLSNMAIVSALVTAIRNVIRVRGALAVVLTFLVSVTYGILQFGLQSEYGIVYGAVVGIATAISYYITRNVGAVVGIKSTTHFQSDSIYNLQREAWAQTNDRKVSLWRILKFIFFRRL